MIQNTNFDFAARRPLARLASSVWLSILAIAAITAIGATKGRAAEHTRDTLPTVQKAVASQQAVLLDVREKSEWDAGHLQAARLLPLSQLVNGVKADEVARVLPKDKIVYCHCAAGGRCLEASDVLRKMGYDVRPLKPGYRDLLKAGFAPASPAKN